jgi:hypothetical protein
MMRTTLIVIYDEISPLQRTFEVGCIIAALEHMHDRCQCEPHPGGVHLVHHVPCAVFFWWLWTLKIITNAGMAQPPADPDFQGKL